MQPLPRHADVLIVGAGPAGLTLAVTLAQLGIPQRDHRQQARRGAGYQSGGDPAPHAGIPRPHRPVRNTDRRRPARRRLRRGRTRPTARADVIRVHRQPVSLSVLGTPVKVRVRWFAFVLASFSPVLEDGGPTVGVEVERPQRSEDERPRGRRRSAIYSVGEGRRRNVVVQVICRSCERTWCGRRVRACQRPALSGSTDDGPAT